MIIQTIIPQKLHHETKFEYFEKYEGNQNSNEYKHITKQITQFYINHLNEKFLGIKEYIKIHQIDYSFGC